MSKLKWRDVNVGDVFGYLTVTSMCDASSGKSKIECLCSCGNTTTPTIRNLMSSNSKSCGCYARNINAERLTTHGFKHTKEYETWIGIKARCLNKNNRRYNSYGGSGITICEEWKNNAEAFCSWYRENGCNEFSQIDRIDNYKGYSPENCRVVTSKQNAQNKKPLGGTSKYKGVSKRGEKYRAKIFKDGVRYNIGTFDSEDEAALAYNKAAYELNGEYAYMNKVD